MTTARTVLAAAAAVLVVLLGAQLLDRGPLARTVAGAAAEGLPAPPQGTRWVGVDDVVVAVPEWWTTGETRCGAPVEDTVYVDVSAVYDCSDAPRDAEVREVSALAVLDPTMGYGELQLRSMQPVGEVGAHEVVELAGCEEWFPGVCRRLFAVPDLDVALAVSIAEEGDGSYEAIRDSVRLLPEGLTTVPLSTSSGWTPGWGAEPAAVDDLVMVLERAGLRVVVEEEAPAESGDTAITTGPLRPGTLLGVSPDLGSVVEVGATVTVTVAG